MKRVLAILGLAISIFFIVISSATICKIIVSGNRERIDIELVLVMVSFFVVSTLLAYLCVKTLDIRFNLPKINMVYRDSYLVILALLSIAGLFIFKSNIGLKWTCMLIGNFSLLIFGTIKGVKANESGRVRYYRTLRGIIGTPVMIYWLIVYLLLEYVIGW